MRVALYARVSTSDQHNEVQLRELTEYAQRRGWEVVGIYQDKLSGATSRRPGLEQLMAEARLLRFQGILVWKLDRLGRSLVHCVSTIQELQALGVRFMAVSQGLDTDESNPAAKLLTHILAAVAQFERELIRERVAAGIKHAKSNGVQMGRPRRVFDRQRALEMRHAGASFPPIAKTLGVGVGTVVRTIKGAA